VPPLRGEERQQLHPDIARCRGRSLNERKIRVPYLMQEEAAVAIALLPSPDGGWRVLELWESEEDARRFRDERLMPAFDAAGVPRPPGRPQIWQLHNYMK
jgi:hypothetical protein